MTVAGPVPASQRVAWFHCFSGIAGDMALGALLDAGADPERVRAILRRLPIDGWSLHAEPVLRGGIACTRALVRVDAGAAGADGPARTHRDIAAMVASAALPARVTERALAVFDALARAEGGLHRLPPAAVHFHEVGGHDAVIDVVGTVAALEVLGVDAVACSAVAVGTGTVRAAHGVLPNPPPAVLRLLEGLPSYGRPVDAELTTPTGAALLRALAGAGAGGPMPAMTVDASGYGAGGRELDDLPNCTQVVVGTAAPPAPGDGQPLSEVSANVDDVTGEQLASAVSRLIGAGAWDAWITPAVMKKGRPGHVVHALCSPSDVAAVARTLRAATGTWGVRAVRAERWPAPRAMDAVVVGGEAVRVKVGAARVKPEPDDVARVARRTGLSVAEVEMLAARAWDRQAGQGGDPAGGAHAGGGVPGHGAPGGETAQQVDE